MHQSNFETRRQLYVSKEFRSEVAERLNFDADRVTLPIEALLQAMTIPSELPDEAEALGTDGMKILLSIGSQVRKGSAIPMVVDRFRAMTLQAELGPRKNSWSTAGSFGADLAKLIREFWEVGWAPRATAIPLVGVSVLWSDPQGRVLFGTLDEWQQGKPRRKKIYASETLRLPSAPGGEWDFVQLPTVGGTTFSSLPLLGFSELLRDGVEDAAARP